jgi:glycosidase
VRLYDWAGFVALTRHEEHTKGGAAREFHVSRGVREACGLEASLFTYSGNVVFADFRAARDFAHRLNEHRPAERAMSASDIYALGLIDEALHLLVARHRRENAPKLWSDAFDLLGEEIGQGSLDEMLRAFVGEFPPTPVFSGEMTSQEYLAGETGGENHRHAVLEELVMLWLANRNPAFEPFRELFDEESLRQTTAYGTAVRRLESYLAASLTSGPKVESLLDLLLAPVRAAPDSLQGQLEFIRTTWADILGPDLHRILGGLDFLAEEHRVRFPVGPGPVEPPDYGVLAETGERYSADRDWMPRLVLLAKNAHVWLAQLSRFHGHEITTLDGIPDEELGRLANWGITALWLIGVWERSRASERIKKRMGDEEAVASAYSLEDYRIADALGGEAGYENLRQRAWRFGIRLSTDMVPNHMGIDSRWVIEHPDWFLSLDHPPYPSYSFSGPDLSDDPRVGVFIEDHYWDRSDAAVVFRRLDRETGDERFIYHGNDGTSMPWNDTAQLDYLKPEVREAVIQTILAVARRSPVIRFDAAMTLARQHYHRLWFPEPGAAGAVPSRAEHSLTRAEFDRAMPREFWRDVVERVAEEAPDTLLLAEAFWLLEGYFVRTLGMHRVYNSAFMNMLRDERNAEYRQLIRSTLEFDPRILKRYVNFMSNPDERTAVDQFGNGDKYFGVATLMATMPGLPMFGHGQIEGLTEKYGMEFQRPRWDEVPNDGLVWRHELQLFPLLRRRRVFAEVDSFLLYDFVRDDGWVDENVFAYSNDVDGERSLVVYHNRYGQTRGRLNLSTAVARSTEGDDKDLLRSTLGDGLRLPEGGDRWVVYRDAVTGLEHLRSCRELRSDGFFFELDAYRLHCFLEFRDVVEDEDHPWSELAGRLEGGGVRSVDDALGQLKAAAVVEPFRRLLSVESLHRLASGEEREEAAIEFLGVARSEVATLLAGARLMAGDDSATGGAQDEGRILTELETVFELARLVANTKSDHGGENGWMAEFGDSLGDPVSWATLLTWVIAHNLRGTSDSLNRRETAGELFSDWHLRSTLVDIVMALGRSEYDGRRAADTVDLMLEFVAERSKADGLVGLGPALTDMIASDAGQSYLRANEHGSVLWFHREAFDELLLWVMLAWISEDVVEDSESAPANIAATAAVWQTLQGAAEQSAFRLDDFLEVLRVANDLVRTGD